VAECELELARAVARYIVELSKMGQEDASEAVWLRRLWWHGYLPLY